MLTPSNKLTLMNYWWEGWPGKGCIECCEEIGDACESGQIEGSREIENFCNDMGQRLLFGAGFKLFNCEMRVEFKDQEPMVHKVLVVAPSGQSIIENGPPIMEARYSQMDEQPVSISFHNIAMGVGEIELAHSSFIELVIVAH